MAMGDNHVDLWAYLHANNRSVNQTTREITEALRKAGRDGSEGLAKEVENAAPRIRKAFNRVAEATVANNRAEREANDIREEGVKLATRRLQLEADRQELQRKSIALQQVELGVAERLVQMRKQEDKALESVAQKEERVAAARAKANAINDYVKGENAKIRGNRKERAVLLNSEDPADRQRAAELKKQIAEDELALEASRRRQMAANKELRDSEADLATSRATLAEFSADSKRTEEELNTVRAETKKDTKELEKIESELSKTRDAQTAITKRQTRADEDAITALNRRKEALKSLHDAEEAERKREENRRRSSRGNSGRDFDRAAGSVGSIFTDIPFVPGGPLGALVGSVVVSDMVSVAEAVTTAAQSIALLPAVAAAGGAAIGTLAIATYGFGDAIKNMGDPKKFAEALQTMSPNAQQAALEIKALVDGPLGDLKRATQDAFFKDVPQQIHELANTFTPVLQQLTTGVATAFNGMFMSFSQAIQTPAALVGIQETVNNIVTAFQNLQPAVAPFVDAIGRLVQVGSSFLPGFANTISNLAQRFDELITKAQADGSLRDFMQRGIDAAQVLIQAVWNLGQELFNVFGNKSPDELRESINGVINDIKTLIGVIVDVAHFIREWKEEIAIAAGAFAVFKVGGAIYGAIQGLATLLGSGGPATVGGALSALPGVAAVAAAGISKALGEIAIPAWLGNLIANGLTGDDKSISDVLGQGLDAPKRIWEMINGTRDPNTGELLPPNPTPQPGAGITDPRTGLPAGQSSAPAGTRDSGGVSIPGTDPRTGLPFGQNERAGGPAPGSGIGHSVSPGAPPPAGLGDWFPKPVPDVPGPKPSQSSERERIISSLNPNDFMPDLSQILPNGAGGVPTFNGGSGVGGPGFKSPGPLEIGTNGMPFQKPGLGYNVTDQKQIFDKEWGVVKAAQDLRDARMELAATEQNTLASEWDKIKAREKLAQQEHDFTDAQLELQEAYAGKWKKAGEGLNSVFGEIGANLDKDLGLSRGLPGLADNLVKFLASLATAPLMGALAPIAAQGDGSYGLFGMAFGGSNKNGSFGQAGANTAVQGLAGVPGTVPYGRNGVYPGDQALLSNVPSGRYEQTQAADLTKGVGDCTSAIEDLVNILDGKSTTGRSLSTGNAQQWLTDHGFIPGMGGPGDFRVGFDAGHMQATLPGGTNFNWGSPEAAASGGVAPNSGAAYGNQHYFRPSGSGVGSPIVNAPSAAAPAASAPQTTPPPVANPAAPSTYQGPPIPPPVPNSVLNSPANTGTGLTDPGLPAPGSLPGGGGGPGSPIGNFPNGSGLGGPSLSPANLPNTGPGVPYQAQGIDYQDPSWQPQGGGGIGIGGGALGGAIQGAIAAAGSGGSMFGGQAAAAAAQMAMQAINRTIKFGGQAAGILAEGALDTFFPTNPDTGKNPMKDSWFWRAAGSLAGAAPAIGSGGAGLLDKASNKKAQDNLGLPGQDDQQKQNPQGGPLLHIENWNGGDQSAKGNAIDLAQNLQAQTNEAVLPRP